MRHEGSRTDKPPSAAVCQCFVYEDVALSVQIGAQGSGGWANGRSTEKMLLCLIWGAGSFVKHWAANFYQYLALIFKAHDSFYTSRAVDHFLDVWYFVTKTCASTYKELDMGLWSDPEELTTAGRLTTSANRKQATSKTVLVVWQQIRRLGAGAPPQHPPLLKLLAHIYRL